MAESLVGASERHGSAGRVVDACAFHEWDGAAALEPYLSEGWREVIMRPGAVNGPAKLRGVYLFEDPRGAAEPGTTPANGAAGSDFDLFRDQVLADGRRDAVVLGYDHSQLATVAANYWMAREVARAANDWTIEEWLSRDSRLFGMVTVSSSLPEDAAAEVRRAGAHPRMVALALGGNALAAPFGHALYHPIYEAASELGLPLVLQTGSDAGADLITPPLGGGLPATAAEYKVLAASSHMSHLTSLIAHGVFDRFPELRVLVVGGGIGWIPSLLWRLDFWFRETRHETPWVSRLPSEYFFDHVCVATHELDDPPGDDGLERLFSTLPGIERMLVYASCYPSRGYAQPDAVAARLPAVWAEQVLGENAERFFRWPGEPTAPKARSSSVAGKS